MVGGVWRVQIFRVSHHHKVRRNEQKGKVIFFLLAFPKVSKKGKNLLLIITIFVLLTLLLCVMIMIIFFDKLYESKWKTAWWLFPSTKTFLVGNNYFSRCQVSFISLKLYLKKNVTVSIHFSNNFLENNICGENVNSIFFSKYYPLILHLYLWWFRIWNRLSAHSYILRTYIRLMETVI